MFVAVVIIILLHDIHDDDDVITINLHKKEG